MEENLPYSEADDPTGEITELAYAARDPAIRIPSDPDHRPACAHLAHSLGVCRLFAIDPGRENGTLPPIVAQSAAEEMTEQVSSLAQTASAELGELWDDSPEEGDEFAYDLIYLRQYAWAVSLALDEALGACQTRQPESAPALARAISDFKSSVDAFDTVLRGELDILCALADDDRLCRDLDRLSRSPHGNPLPWWLDGTLGDHARRLNLAAVQAQPPQAHWDGAFSAPPLPPLAEPQSPATRTYVLNWLSPGGVSCAELIVWLTDDNELAYTPTNDHLVFRAVNASGDSPAYDLAGQLVQLGDASFRLDRSGVALINHANLGPGPLTLRVGSPPRTWSYQLPADDLNPAQPLGDI